MQLVSLKLRDFRNYEELELEFGGKTNLIKGKNAQGKTNLIEAIYMLGFARSFRTVRDRDLIRFNKSRADISAVVEDGPVKSRISMEIGRDGKSVKCDGKKISRMTDLLDKFYVVIFSPEDLGLVKDSPEKRRNFIDRELSKVRPAYFESYIRYRRALRQRNTCLKEKNMIPGIIDIWDEELARYGTDIVRGRKRFVRELQEVSGGIHRNITGGREKLSLEYEASIGDDEDFTSVLKDNFAKDRMNGSTGRGPHRDDLKICVDGSDIRHYGSQGQQRTAALSLKLAEVTMIREITGRGPVLLLDDVLSELDITRQEYLLKSLEDVQMFITTADISGNLAAGISEKTVFDVSGGRVARI